MSKQEIQKFLPGTYLTDGYTLLWVIERTSATTLLAENVKTAEEIELGDADLIGYSPVRRSSDDE